MAGGDYLYLINTIDGIYVGKLADRDVWNAHLGRTDLPWYRGERHYTTDESSSRWERKWTNDIYTNGFANQTYVQSIYIWDSAQVAAAIQNSFGTNPVFASKSARYTNFDALKRAWHLPGKTDGEIAEALLIILAAKNHVILNTQVDFLRHKGARLTAEDAEQMLSREQFEAREINALVRTPSLFITLTPQNNFMGIIEGITEKMKNELERNGNTKVRVTLSSQFLPQLAKEVTKKTLEHLIRDLKNYKSKIQGTPAQVKEARASLQQHINILRGYINNPNSMKTANGDIYNVRELYEQTLQAMDSAHNQYKAALQASEHQDFDILAAGLKDWYDTHTLEDFLDISSGSEVQKPVNQYCFLMTKWIAANVFGATYDSAYSEEQHTVWAENEAATRRGGLHFLPATGDPYAPRDLQTTSRDRLRAVAPRATYLYTNWVHWKAYSEQVTYWLATNNDVFYQKNYFNRYYKANLYMDKLTDNIKTAASMPQIKYY